jgi:ABC-type antimicrobial peptide transport system permease subunit
MRSGLQWACVGVVIGIGGALAFGRALSNLLFGITATDPVTLAIVIAVLAAVAVTASSLPAFRATKVDPTVALRHE